MLSRVRANVDLPHFLGPFTRYVGLVREEAKFHEGVWENVDSDSDHVDGIANGMRSRAGFLT
jgi:hypothetical protein